MKTSFVRVLSVLLALMMVGSVVLLASCNEEEVEPLTPTQIWKTDFEEEGAVKQAIKLSGVTDMTVEGVCGNLAVFTGTDEDDTDLEITIVYDLVAGNTIKRITDECEIAFVESNPHYTKGETLVGFIVAKEDSEGVVTSTLYDATYAEVATANYDASATNVNDLLVFGNVAYRFDEAGKLNKAFDMGLKTIPTDCIVTDTANYAVQEDAVVMYDASYNVTDVYEFAAGAENVAAYVLADGNLLIQYSVRLLDNASSYDYMRTDVLADNGLIAKYDLVTVIYNVTDKTTTDVKADYFVSTLSNRKMDTAFADTYVEDINVAYLNYIEDKFVKTTASAVILDNAGAVVEALDTKFAEKYGTSVQLVADNRFVVTDALGLEFVMVDETGNVLGSIQNIDEGNDALLILDNRYVYDYSLSLKYTLADNEAIHTVANDALIITKTVEKTKTITDGFGGEYTETETVVTYYLLDKTGNKTKIADTSNDTSIYAAGDLYYCVRKTTEDGEVRYTYYNYAGEQLHTSTVALSFQATAEDGVLFSMTKLNEETYTYVTTYYFFAK